MSGIRWQWPREKHGRLSANLETGAALPEDFSSSASYVSDRKGLGEMLWPWVRSRVCSGEACRDAGQLRTSRDVQSEELRLLVRPGYECGDSVSRLVHAGWRGSLFLAMHDPQGLCKGHTEVLAPPAVHVWRTDYLFLALHLQIAADLPRPRAPLGQAHGGTPFTVHGRCVCKPISAAH